MAGIRHEPRRVEAPRSNQLSNRVSHIHDESMPPALTMSQDRVPSALFAIGWLFVLHGLADIMVGIYRCHDVDRALTDLLAASLTRSQLCLLAIWLAAGSERFSWRICGLIAGSCFVFIVFSRFVFPGAQDIGRDVFWLDEQWAYYFRLSGPGDVLIKAPILIGGLVVPLFIWRGWRAVRSVRQAGLPRVNPARWLRFQFRMQDIIVWIVTLSVALAATYRTSPYPGWYGDLTDNWREVARLKTPQDVYCAASAVLYVFVAGVSLWAVYSKMLLRFRIPIALTLVITPAFGFELWLRVVAKHTTSDSLAEVWGQASDEVVPSILAATIMAGSLMLVRFYGMVTVRCRRRTELAFAADLPPANPSEKNSPSIPDDNS